jgi:phosphoserine phosphatase RsbU/P
MAEAPADRQAEAWRAATAELLARTRFVTPSQLPHVVAAVLAGIGSDARIHLVDHEQRQLRPLPARGVDALDVDGSPAGAAFRYVEAVREGGWTWYPLLDGSERLGVIRLDGSAAGEVPTAVRSEINGFTALVGHLIAVMSVYGDAFEHVRRTAPMSPAAELVMQMLPPLTYGGNNFVVSAILQPIYAMAGDGFDYAVTDSTLYVAIMDSTGHNLGAGLTTAVTLAATRAARRAGAGVAEQAAAADRALAGEFRDARFTTAVLAEINLETGVLRYVNAGHPPPLVLRGDKVVDTLDQGRRTPLGVAVATAPRPGEVLLEPGDRLLAYTDGVVEGVDADGVAFDLARLTELATRHAADGLSAPETLRQMAQDVLARWDGPPIDDATLLLVEWSGEAVRRLAP